MNKVLLCIGVVAVAVWSAPAGGDAMLLSDVKTLQFRAGEYAVNTRTPEDIPRLTCAYNPLEGKVRTPDNVICKNKGLDDGGNVVWKCEADMDDALAFDNIQVSCEGYNFPGDKYIRAGSCALTYTLKLTPAAKNKYNAPPNAEHYNVRVPRGDANPPPHYVQTGAVKATSGWTFTNVLILVLVCAVIIRCCCKKGKKKNNDIDNFNERTYDNSQPAYNPDYKPEFTPGYNAEPSAPNANDAEPTGTMSKRTGYAETVSR